MKIFLSILLLCFTSSLLSMASGGAGEFLGARELDRSIGELVIEKLDQLPEDLITNVLEHNFDLAEISQICKLFRGVVKSIIKKRWEKLKSQQKGQCISGLINSIEDVYGPEASYKHFRDLYNSLAKMAGKSPMKRKLSMKVKNFLARKEGALMPVSKPEGIDISNIELLLNMDQDVQDLVRVWPRLHRIIIQRRLETKTSTSFFGPDAPAGLIGEWLGDKRNRSEINTLFSIAVTNGIADMVKVLLVAGVDVNYVQEWNSYSALMCAVQGGDFEVVKLLLEHGANPNHVNIHRDTVLIVASFIGLMPSGLIPLMGDYQADDAVERKCDIVKLLLKFGADVNAVDRHGYNALARHASSFSGRDEVEALLQYNPDVIPEARDCWHPEVRQILEQARRERARLGNVVESQQSFGAGGV